MRDPALAGILSLLIPGLGQIYNGRVIIGIIWMLVFGVSWIGSVGLFGWVIHIISAWCAYSYAKDHPVRHAYPNGKRRASIKKLAAFWA